MDIRVGDIITLKKQHPCGSKDWEVLRIGADFRLKCKGCDRPIPLPLRRAVHRNGTGMFLKRLEPEAYASGSL